MSSETLITITTILFTAFPSIDADKIDIQQVDCLTQNIYFESRNESVKGQSAVAHVTLNRVDSKDYPNTICKVVWETRRHRSTKKRVPMFSWTLDGRSDRIHLVYKAGQRKGEINWVNYMSYKSAVMEAIRAMTGISKDPTDGATHYYAHNLVTPRWAKSKKLEQTAIIENHTFLRQPGDTVLSHNEAEGAKMTIVDLPPLKKKQIILTEKSK